MDWTEAGRALVADRAYRAISPVFVHDKAGTVTRVLRASLVNAPNLRGLAPLHMETQMNLHTRLATHLGLAADATEDQIVAAIPANVVALQSAIAQIGAALGVAGAEPAAIVAAAAAKPAAVPAEMTAMQAELTSVTTQMAALESQTRRDKATAFVDAAITQARPGVKPRRDYYIARHMAEPAETEATVNAIPAFGPGRMLDPGKLTEGGAAGGDLTALSAEQQGRALHDRAVAWQSEQKACGLTVALFDAITHVKKDVQL